MANPRQEDKSTQGMEDAARRAGESAAEQTTRIGQAAADQTARVGQAAAEAGEEVARASANLLKQNVETLQNAWRFGLEAATSAMGENVMSATIRPATMKGPAIFLAQFIGDAQPFDSFDAICGWAARLGYKGVQVPTSDLRLIDIDKAAASQTYCDEIVGVAASHGLVITELSTHLQGQLVAVHPAYNESFDAFAPPAVRGRPNERQIWAVDQMMKAAQASRRLGLTGSVSFTGALAWPFLYPWPQRPPGLIETAFDELARRWRPILDAYEEAGVDLCYEVHPGEDVCDGTTFEMFYERTGNHPRCAINYDPSHFVLQQLDYLAFIDIYAERIRAFHVKDAEFNPTGRQGVYSGFQSWIDRAGRFRSLGDGQVDFKAIFSRLAAIGFDRWAVLEWECCLKNAEDGAREGAGFIRDHIIRVTERAFDDFAGGASDDAQIRRTLGLI